MRARLDRAELFPSAESQIVLAWGGADDEAEIEGDISLVTDAPDARGALAFASWLTPEKAQNLAERVDRLRARGEAFRCSVTTRAGRCLDIEGRPVNGCAVMRIRDVGWRTSGGHPPATAAGADDRRTANPSGRCSTLRPIRRGCATRKGGSPESTPPTPAPSKRGTRRTPSRAASSCWIARRAR